MASTSPYEQARKRISGQRRISTAVAILTVAAMLVAPASLAYISTAGIAPNAPVEGDACSAYDISGGTGGQTVSCHIDCAKGAFLVAAVHAFDEDAKTGVDFSCGEAEAIQGCPTNTCAKKSDHLTKEREQNATCTGESNEMIDSGITVACLTTPNVDWGDSNPLVYICDQFDDFPVCDDHEAGFEASVYSTCAKQNPLLADEDSSLLARLIPPLNGPALAITSMLSNGPGSVMTLIYTTGINDLTDPESHENVIDVQCVISATQANLDELQTTSVSL